MALGPPLINPSPNLTDPNPPLPAWLTPSPRVPGTGDPDDAPPAPPGPAAPSAFGGNVGPVGSRQERDALALITGRPATVATELLLGPLARGTVVSLRNSGAGGEPR
ncbi:hypothetical protein MSHO_61320 [Mycobacterium shottsii]|uniref:Uncharacterized protein n=1 Tax=Mycobacterium shottsii TaxID=133549 RepID=A0A7I7LMJ7_9MYCO|nr:hypothetical protein MSHO_61320 [Mycobacterium shottsii]